MALILLQDTGPKGGAAAPAPDGGAAGAQPPPFSSAIMFIPIVLMLVFMFFTQSRRQKKEAEQRKQMKRGDKVLSQSGIVGELVDIDERFAKIKIAPGVNVQVLASTLQPLGAATDTASPKSDTLADLKEAKASAGDKK